MLCCSGRKVRQKLLLITSNDMRRVFCRLVAQPQRNTKQLALRRISQRKNRKMKKLSTLAMMALTISLTSAMVQQASAATIYNATETAIFGSGNPDTNWVETSNGGVTVDIRFKERFTTNMPNDGAGTYTFALGTSVNVEWSGDSGTAMLSQYAWILSYDTDPSAGTLWASFPVSLSNDNSYGNSSTPNGAGIEDTYVNAAGSNSKFQNSFRTGLFPFGLNPNIDATHNFAFTAYDVSDTAFRSPLASAPGVLVFGAGAPATGVPDTGSTFAMLGLAMTGMIFFKKKRSAA
jgi:hypothetical protein